MNADIAVGFGFGESVFSVAFSSEDYFAIQMPG